LNLSFGAGATLRKLDAKDPGVRPAGGIFLDREESVIASLVINGSDDLAVRLNVYPLPAIGYQLEPLGLWIAPAAYLAVGDRGQVTVGFTVSFPGVGLSN
jgi:hypothetical protein